MGLGLCVYLNGFYLVLSIVMDFERANSASQHNYSYYNSHHIPRRLSLLVVRAYLLNHPAVYRMG